MFFHSYLFITNFDDLAERSVTFSGLNEYFSHVHFKSEELLANIHCLFVETLLSLLKHIVNLIH